MSQINLILATSWYQYVHHTTPHQINQLSFSYHHFRTIYPIYLCYLFLSRLVLQHECGSATESMMVTNKLILEKVLLATQNRIFLVWLYYPNTKVSVLWWDVKYYWPRMIFLIHQDNIWPTSLHLVLYCFLPLYTLSSLNLAFMARVLFFSPGRLEQSLVSCTIS